eukprot:gene24028-29076_t
MTVSERLLVQLISPWLTVKDFMRLDTASSHALHGELRLYLLSKTFPDQIGYRFAHALVRTVDLPECTRWAMLRWLHMTRANLPGLTVNIDASFLALLDSEEDSPVEPMFLVSSINFLPSSRSQWSSFLYLAPMFFPMVNYLTVTYYNSPTSYTIDDRLYTSLTVLGKLWPLQHIDIRTQGHSVSLTSKQITLLQRLFCTIGSRLETFNVTYEGVPQRLVDRMAEFCPNMQSLFPSCRFDPLISASHYFQVSQRLKNIKHLLLVSDCGLQINDDVLIPALQQLPGLKEITIGSAQITAASLVTAVQYCPDLVRFHNSDRLYFIIKRKPVSGEVSSSLDIWDYRMMDHPSFLDLLQNLPRLSSLMLYDPITIEQSTTLGALFSQSTCREHLQSLSVHSKSFGSILPLFRNELVNLTTLTLTDLEETAFASDGMFSTCFQLVQLHCPALHRVRLHSPTQMTDEDFDAMLQMLRGRVNDVAVLFTIDDTYRLSKQVLASMAKAQQMWDLVMLPSCLIEPPDLIESITTHGLKIKKLLLFGRHSQEKFYRFPAGPVTVEDVLKVCGGQAIIDDGVFNIA